MSKISSFIVGNKGRIVVPKGIRDEAGFEEGTRVTAFVDDLGRIVIETPDSVKARIRRRATQTIGTQHSVVDELLEERRSDVSLLDSKRTTTK